MTLLTVDDIIRLHDEQEAVIGGNSGLQYPSLLEKIVLGVNTGSDKMDPPRTIEGKAAWLCYSIICDYPFVDSNKRTGILAMLMTLRLNGVLIVYSQNELAQLGWDIYAGRMKCPDVLDWIVDHRQVVDLD